MDKMIHTALNSMHMITQNQSMNAQNLSNLNVTGYRRDLGIEFETTYLETMEGLDAKAFATRTNVGVFSSKPGHINPTGEDLDVAVIGCYVNGPGESKHTTIGVTGGSPKNLIYIDGKPDHKVDSNELAEHLEGLIRDKIKKNKEQESSLILKS